MQVEAAHRRAGAELARAGRRRRQEGPSYNPPAAGHADSGRLSGQVRLLRRPNVLERASARETRARVPRGCGPSPSEGIGVEGLVVHVRGWGAWRWTAPQPPRTREEAEASPLAAARIRPPEERMVARIDEGENAGEHSRRRLRSRRRAACRSGWASTCSGSRLDAALAAAVVSIQSSRA